MAAATLGAFEPADYAVIAASGERGGQPADSRPDCQAVTQKAPRLLPPSKPGQAASTVATSPGRQLSAKPPIPIAGLTASLAVLAGAYTVPWRCCGRGAGSGSPGKQALTRDFNVLWHGRAALSLLSATWAVRARAWKRPDCCSRGAAVGFASGPTRLPRLQLCSC